MCGDSTNEDDVGVLVGDQPAALLFTDPPYGVDYGGGRPAGKGTKKVKAHGRILNDNLQGPSLSDFFEKFISVAIKTCRADAPFYLCLSWLKYHEFLSAVLKQGLSPDHCIVWAKPCLGLGHSNYRPQHEFIFYARRGGSWYGNAAQSDLWQFARENTANYVHPTQKPVRLVERAILNSSRKGDVVLDLFGGSGTTLIACEKRERAARLMELDPKYCDTIIRRWQANTGLQAIHAESNKPFEG